MIFTCLDHVSVLCRDYEVSKKFYITILGFRLIREEFRWDRFSWRGELSLRGRYLVELTSLPNAPARLTNPEATGGRHLAFACGDFDSALAHLRERCSVESVRFDALRKRRFTFFFDPDGLPTELVEAKRPHV